MNYLSIEQLSKSYNEQPLFNDLTFGISQGQKVALVGKNGCGKSTLLKIIGGLETPDSGKVVFRKGVKVGFLLQNPEFSNHLSIRDYIFNQESELLSTIKEYEKLMEKEDHESSGEKYETILHKMDVGGVKIGIKTPEAVKEAFASIMESAQRLKPDADIKGVLVQKMVPPGQEVILGVSKHPGFGHLIMFGLGGIYVELFKNVTFRLAPIGRNNARRMIRSIKGYEILNGYRGKPKADIEQLEKLIVGLSSLVTDFPEIKEMDINPLIVHEEGMGATVADIIITFEFD